MGRLGRVPQRHEWDGHPVRPAAAEHVDDVVLLQTQAFSLMFPCRVALKPRVQVHTLP